MFFCATLHDLRLGSELTPQKQLKEEADAMMQQLMNFVHYTAVSI